MVAPAFVAQASRLLLKNSRRDACATGFLPKHYLSNASLIRNTFSLEKITYHDETGTVIYRSQMSHGKNKKNFQSYTAEEFIAAITQHIPEKSFQMVRYYEERKEERKGSHLK